jgi:hypothetical protein
MTKFPFSDLHSFKDCVIYVQTYLPDRFPLERRLARKISGRLNSRAGVLLGRAPCPGAGGCCCRAAPRSAAACWSTFKSLA